ncbi:hypothetical protein CI102_6676 [Trichoderma harzianum]|uniref:Uncharacterized protein n=1 Tax=Trichoderma harzianum CBS 226.95 TaxID=983964 RepID=A0A2T4AE93_TRIHA|nr:hypothetical protein M431DRAFT_83968 [Trichoderma harzianum CBS 226.95]PKK48790.1 hypothetical protein CI102_6676 [Trichoderma harzianum]PTB55410.1 hypothetical protein M431DRAFT_83968 [Trichoderma harzianum CBS 226.95]
MRALQTSRRIRTVYPPWYCKPPANYTVQTWRHHAIVVEIFVLLLYKRGPCTVSFQHNTILSAIEELSYILY